MAAPACSIVGIGESKVGQVPDRSTLQLQTDETLAALEDAGLKLDDIDGLLTTPIRTEAWNMPCGVVANHLGVRASYLSTVDPSPRAGEVAAQHRFPVGLLSCSAAGLRPPRGPGGGLLQHLAHRRSNGDDPSLPLDQGSHFGRLPALESAHPQPREAGSPKILVRGFHRQNYTRATR